MFGLEEGFQPLNAVQPTKTAFLKASGFDFGMHAQVLIDPYRAGLQTSGQSLPGFEIAGPYTRSQAEPGVVRPSQSVLVVHERTDRKQGTEDLVL